MDNSVENIGEAAVKKPALWRVLFILILPPFLIFAGITIFAIAYSVIGSGGAANIDNAIAENIGYLFVLNHSLLFILLVWFLRIDGLKFRDIGFRLPENGLAGIVFELGFAILSTALVIVILINVLPFFEGVDEATKLTKEGRPLGNVFLFSLFAGVFVASFVEETLYRGYGITGLGRHWGIIVAVIITSILFGPLHFGFGIVGIIRSMFQGLVFALLFIRSKSLLAPMTSHSLINLYATLSAFDYI